jgi:uncharacterized membrane protein
MPNQHVGENLTAKQSVRTDMDSEMVKTENRRNQTTQTTQTHARFATNPRGKSVETLAFLTAGVVTTLTLFVAFSLLAVGFEYFWVTFIVGFGGGLPIALGVVASRDESGTEQHSDNSALEELRMRYARGELTDEEFEHRVELLLNSEQ